MISVLKRFIELTLEVIRILDCDLRADVYFAIIGLFAAIAIFIAEIITSKDTSILENKIILRETKIVQEFFWIIITLFMIWFNSLLFDIKEWEINQYTIVYVLYYINQIIINALIIRTAIKTFNIFKTTIEIKKDKEYLDKLVSNYTIDKIGVLTKKKEELEKEYKVKRNLINSILPRLTIGYSDEAIKENYKNIYAEKDGTITDIDISNIAKNIYLKDTEILESNIFLNIPIFLTKEIGTTIYKGDCIAQYLVTPDHTRNNTLEKIIKSSITITNENILILKELSLCFNYQIDLIQKKESNSIINFYNKLKAHNEGFFQFTQYIYEEIDKNNINEIFINNLHSLLKYMVKNEEKKEHFYYCINILGKIITNEIKKCQNSEQVNDYIFNDFMKMINQIYNIAEVKNKEEYFDIINYYILKVITYLINNKELKAVDIIIDNLGYLKYSKNNEDVKITNVKRHFIIALTYIFITYLNEKNDYISEIKESKTLINNIYKNLNKEKVFTIDAIETVNLFDKLYKSDCNITHTYNHLSLDLIDHKYKRTWGGNYSEYKTETLITILTLFNSRYIPNENNKLPEYNRYSCDFVLDLLNNPDKLNLLKFLNKNINLKNRFEKLFLDIKDEDKKRETEYLISTPLSDKVVNSFKKTILEEMKNKSLILKKFEQINKENNSNEKLKKVTSYISKVSRDTFFDKEENYIVNYAKEIAESMKYRIEKDILDKLPTENMKETTNILETIKNIKDPTKYTFLINYEDSIKYFDYIKDDYIIVDKKKVKIIETVKDYSMLIHNNDWPILKYCTFAKNVASNSKCIEDVSYYIEIIDLAQKENEELVKKYVNKNENKYDDNYYKTRCILKFLVSYRIESCPCNNSYIQIKNKK